MIALLSILTLIILPVAMLVLHLLRPRFSYFWLIATSGALVAWLMILISGARLSPYGILLGNWQPGQLFSTSPLLSVNSISWPFALALGTLLLAVILSDAGRLAAQDDPLPSWTDWGSSLALTATALLAVMSGNLLTLTLAWTALDLLELLIWIEKTRNSQEYEQVVIAFSGRLAGTILVIWTSILTHAGGPSFSLSDLSPTQNIVLLLAAGLRLILFPHNLPLLKDLQLSRGLNTILLLAPAGATLALVPNLAIGGLTQDITPVFYFLAGLFALYGGLSWSTARDEIEGQTGWIWGLAALAMGSAVQMQPAASLIWGLALLLCGGLVLLYSPRHRYLLPLVLLGGLALSGLPLTPTWKGLHLYQPLSWPAIFLLAGHGLLLAGYVRHSLRPEISLAGVERWVWFIYPWGLSLLPGLFFVMGWMGSAAGQSEPPALLASWPGLAAILLGGLFFFAWRRGRYLSPRLTRILRPSLPARWLYNLFWYSYRFLGRLLPFISNVLEGRGGILWALLLLTLLLSLLAQASGGG